MRVQFALATLAVVIAGTPVATHAAADAKAVSVGASCIAYGPDTAAAELQFTTTGIYNPGVTNEKVMCALPRDADSPYAADNTITVSTSYRVLGGVASRMTCTLFVGSTSSQTTMVNTHTSSGQLVSGGNYSGVGNIVSTQSSAAPSAPNTLLCVLPPKTSMGGLWVVEGAAAF
jgi:hypothetical protein